MYNKFGFITEEKAKESGFTHHGSHYGVPIYMAEAFSDSPEIACKFYWLEWALDCTFCMESFFLQLMNVSDPMFRFVVKGEIE